VITAIADSDASTPLPSPSESLPQATVTGTTCTTPWVARSADCAALSWQCFPLQPRTAERAYEPGVDDHVKPHTDPLGISLQSEGPSWLSSPPRLCRAAS